MPRNLILSAVRKKYVNKQFFYEQKANTINLYPQRTEINIHAEDTNGK